LLQVFGGIAGMASHAAGRVSAVPDVWSGRASQVDFAELAVSGLASMYPACDWSVFCSGPSWISARLRSHYAEPVDPAIRTTHTGHSIIECELLTGT
jgi:hypothetical protein